MIVYKSASGVDIREDSCWLVGSYRGPGGALYRARVHMYTGDREQLSSSASGSLLDNISVEVPRVRAMIKDRRNAAE
jgi:hypothetical protein